MKLTVDAHLCSGHGRCYTLVPELFTTDDEGFCGQRGQVIDVPAGLEDPVELGRHHRDEPRPGLHRRSSLREGPVGAGDHRLVTGDQRAGDDVGTGDVRVGQRQQPLPAGPDTSRRRRRGRLHRTA